MEKLVKSIVSQLNNYGVEQPDVAVILGSGLADLINDMEEKIVIPFTKLDGMLLTRVEGHKNQFIYGKIGQKKVLAMQGRFHLYDGFSAKQVCLPIYIFKELGIKNVIITNASGSLTKEIGVGDLMIITDHINFTGQNALIGGPIIDYGEQFIEMTNPYSQKMIDLAYQTAKENNINLKSGVYGQVIGPFYETIAYSKMLKTCGCDAVGMSTVVEVEAANQCKLNVLGVSVVTDMAGIEVTNHQIVIQQSQLASAKLKAIVGGVIKGL